MGWARKWTVQWMEYTKSAGKFKWSIVHTLTKFKWVSLDQSRTKETGENKQVTTLKGGIKRNRNFTWEVLRKKGWQGPERCTMCKHATESNVHMFFQCASSLHLWYELSLSFGFPYRVFSSVQDGFKWWSEQSSSWRTLFVLVCWFLWKWRNAHIFQDSRVPLESILFHISANHHLIGWFRSLFAQYESPSLLCFCFLWESKSLKSSQFIKEYVFELKMKNL